MSALLTLAKSLGIDPGPLNQTELQEQTCSKAMAEIQHLAAQLDKACEPGCTPADAKKLREFNHELADEVMKLKHERDEALTLVIRYQRLLECAVRSEEFVVGDAIFIGIDTDLADEIEESFDESPKAALAALKAQWQADILAEISLQVSASKPEATPMQIATAILDELKRIRQRAQEAGDE